MHLTAGLLRDPQFDLEHVIRIANEEIQCLKQS